MRCSDWGSLVVLLAALAGLPGAHAANDPANDPTPAEAFAGRVLQSGDHGRLPFAVVDKTSAMIRVYRADGRLAGSSPVLLGEALGDQSVPGVGERAQSGRLRSSDRTTAAGRFVSEPGRNRAGEAIVWIDYDNALAIHRLRPGPDRQQRVQRLASTKVGDKRVSAGCVVVPESFFDAVVEPVLGRSRGVVYVMPEDGPSQAL